MTRINNHLKKGIWKRSGAMRLAFCLLLYLMHVHLLTAQNHKNREEINPFSLKKIASSDIAFQKTLWLRVYLNEKANQPLRYAGHDLAKFLIEAALLGRLTAYKNDSLTSVFSNSELVSQLAILSKQHKGEAQTDITDGSVRLGKLQAEIPSDTLLYNLTKINLSYDYRSANILEIKQNWIFDKKHSRMVHDVLAFTLLVPHNAPTNYTGLTQQLVSFSYKEVIEKLFRPLQEDFVHYNNKRYPNFETLMDIRFFHGYIIKYDNFDNTYLEDDYPNPKTAWIKAMQYEEFLIEFENCLWVY